MNIQLKTAKDLIKFSHINKLLETLKFALSINIFDAIGQTGQTINDLSQKIFCDKNHLQHIINALASLGLIKQSNNYIFNMPVSMKYLSNAKPNNLIDLLLHGAHSELTAKNLIRNIITDDISPIKKDIVYMSAMEEGSKYIALKISSRLIKKKKAILLDLGCGSGVFSVTACKMNKNLSAVCVDRENVLLRLKQNLSSQIGLKNRIRFVCGDILKLKFDENYYDYILLSNILHFFDIDTINAIISSCHKCLKSNGEIIINDIFVCRNNLYNILFSLEWLSNGISFITKEQMSNILSDKGFQNIVHHANEQYSTDLISAMKP